MNQQQQQQIVIECQRLAQTLWGSCSAWLQTSTEKRQESAGHELSAAADAMYTHLNNFPEIMGSDTGKPAFDTPDDAEFQEHMNNLWEHEAD